MPDGIAKWFVGPYQFGMKNTVRGHDDVSFWLRKAAPAPSLAAHTKRAAPASGSKEFCFARNGPKGQGKIRH
jgi:hypothetical protein